MPRVQHPHPEDVPEAVAAFNSFSVAAAKVQEGERRRDLRELSILSQLPLEQAVEIASPALASTFNSFSVAAGGSWTWQRADRRTLSILSQLPLSVGNEAGRVLWSYFQFFLSCREVISDYVHSMLFLIFQFFLSCR